MTVSPQLRAILLASVLAALAAGLGLYTLSQTKGGSSGTDETMPPAASLASPQKAAPKTAPKAPTTGKAYGGNRSQAVEARKNPFVEDAEKAGLPPAIANAFGAHEVVVVALYTPNVTLDSMAKDEARAGAALAHAGFVAVNVRSEGTATVLTKLAGILDAPGSLVYRRPGELFMKFEGFNDRATIAQAAENADPSPGGAETTAWARDANAICSATAQKIAAVPTPTSKAQLIALGPQVQTYEADKLAKLHALTPAAGAAPQVRAMLGSYDQAFASEKAMLSALIANDDAKAASLNSRATAFLHNGDRIARQLGATSCVNG